MAFCAKCGTNVPDGAGFCPSCGAAAGSVTDNRSMTTSQTSGLPSNIGGLLSYIVIIAIVFLIIEPMKNDKFIRFHAFQSIFYWIAVIVIFMLIGLVMPLSVWILIYWPLRLLSFILMIFLMFKAYNNEKFKLPAIGDLAEKQA
jgi:uncharacterized membrane protein